MRLSNKTTWSTVLAAMVLLAGCTSDDEPEAKPTPSKSPSSSDESEPRTRDPDYTILGSSHLLGPGRWGVSALGDPDAPVTVFDVPEGFQGHESWVWTDNGTPREFAQLASWAPTRVLMDPCNANASSPRLGPTVRDLAGALGAQKRTTATKPIRVTRDGHEGLYVELTTPRDVDYEACGPDGMQIWEAGPTEVRALDAPMTDRYWIFDVDGRRVVVSALTARSAASRTVGLITGVAETMRFDAAS